MAGVGPRVRRKIGYGGFTLRFERAGQALLGSSVSRSASDEAAIKNTCWLGRRSREAGRCYSPRSVARASGKETIKVIGFAGDSRKPKVS